MYRYRPVTMLAGPIIITDESVRLFTDHVQRDVGDDDCEFFDPEISILNRTCDGDGHYMCKQCASHGLSLVKSLQDGGCHT